MKIKHEKGHYLTKEQKELKQKIMEGLMDVMRNSLLETNIELSHQNYVDLILSCIIMFSRDTIFGLAHCVNDPELLINQVTSVIKKELLEKLNLINSNPASVN